MEMLANHHPPYWLVGSQLAATMLSLLYSLVSKWGVWILIKLSQDFSQMLLILQILRSLFQIIWEKL